MRGRLGATVLGLLACVTVAWAETRTFTCQYQMLPGQWSVISVADMQIHYQSNPSCFDSDSVCNYYPDWSDVGTVENPQGVPTCKCYAATRMRCVEHEPNGEIEPYNSCTTDADCGMSDEGQALTCEAYTYLPLCKTKYVWDADGANLQGVFCRSTLPLSGYGNGTTPTTTTTTLAP